MSIISLLASISTVAVLAGCENIIMRDDENNGYDDSDFYYVGFNAITGDYFKHYHSTTRAGGFTPLPNSVMVNTLSEAAKKEAQAYYKAACIKEATRLMTEHYDYIISVGDVVTVSNKRARNHKGETFTVLEKSLYRDQYGRIQTVYLHGAGGIKTSKTNCTRVQLGAEVINEVAERLACGLAIKY